jgi:hypothetical protein
MNVIRLLVVEDNAADREAWERAIERHNASVEASGSTPILLKTADSPEDANRYLESSEVHAAVIDLRLDGNGPHPDDSAGNDVLQSVLAQELAVTAIFTGQPGDARIPANLKGHVKVFTKGGDDAEGIGSVMVWLVEQFPLVQCIQEATQSIRREMASVFSQSIWPRWKFWMTETDAAEKVFLSTSVARHIVSHVYESLSDKLAGRAHAEEWYLLPPNPSGIRTGDLIRSASNDIEIVVTPRCDFATGKYQTVQLALCEDISTPWDDSNRKISELRVKLDSLKAEKGDLSQAEKELGKEMGKVSSYIRHGGNRNAVHFLPRMKLAEGEAVGPLLVHFDQIRSVAKDSDDLSVAESGRRFASLSPVFLPSLVERLGGFFSRIGTPDYCHIDEGAGTPSACAN